STPSNFVVAQTQDNGETWTVITDVTRGTNFIQANGVTDNGDFIVGEINCESVFPTVTALTNNISCQGGTDGSIFLDVQGGIGTFAYSWSNASTETSLTELSADTFTVIVTATAGCKDTIEIILTEPAAVTASANSTAVCEGSDINLISDGGTFYIW